MGADYQPPAAVFRQLQLLYNLDRLNACRPYRHIRRNRLGAIEDGILFDVGDGDATECLYMVFAEPFLHITGQLGRKSGQDALPPVQNRDVEIRAAFTQLCGYLYPA
ncbi:hypothetical protein D3C73_1366590 [compost metagenome]